MHVKEGESVENIPPLPSQRRQSKYCQTSELGSFNKSEEWVCSGIDISFCWTQT